MQTALTIWFIVSIVCIVLALATPERLIPELVEESTPATPGKAATS